MHIHILGICGTFMGGIAAIAKQSGHKVTGCDQNIYPPMSTQLEHLGIDLHGGFDEEQVEKFNPDIYVVGNIMTRGMPIVERLLREKRPIVSGPDWLYQHVLHKHRVIAVAGTHGKTTTSALVAWILQDNGKQPGFLIGGVPGNFDVSARLGSGKTFVIEADEYDTAFFDKRSKFIHYHPDILILNNLEFDHADIFNSLEDIERQFHHLIKLIPDTGQLLANADDIHLKHLLKLGFWSKLNYFGQSNCQWRMHPIDRHKFQLHAQGHEFEACSTLPGEHNQLNLSAAISACYYAGVSIEKAIESARKFKPPRRRLELKFQSTSLRVFDDFAHHPTAILKTIQAVKEDNRHLVVVFEPRSNSMRSGAHSKGLESAFSGADEIIFYQGESVNSDFGYLTDFYQNKLSLFTKIDTIIEHLNHSMVKHTDILFMSNGGFENIVNKFTQTINRKFS